MKAFFVSLLGVFTAGSAVGQQITSPYRFVEATQSGGAFFGVLRAGGSTLRQAPTDGQIAGLRYTIRLSGPFTVEAEAGYFQGKRTVRDTIVVDSAFQAAGEAEVGLLTLNGSLRFNLTGPRTWHGLQPYAVFGAGAAIDVIGENGDDDKVAADVRYTFGTSFAGQLGGGVEWFATDRLTLRLDARNALWKTRTPVPFTRTSIGGRLPADEWVQNGIFSLGLALHF